MLSCLGAAATGCNGPESVRITSVTVPELRPVTCEMFRGECIREAVRDTFTLCDIFGYSPSSFVATACPTARDAGDAAATCRRQFCADPLATLYGYSECRVLSATTAPLPMAGVCTPDPAATGAARASFVRRSRTCASDGTVCTALVASTTRDIACVDVSTMAAADFLPAASDERDRSIQIIQFEPNSPACLGRAEDLQAFTVPAAPVASVTGLASAGAPAPERVTATLSATSGAVLIRRACDVDGGCSTRLERLRVTLANVTIAGMPLTNVVVRSSVPALLTPASEGTATTIAPGQLRLTVEGRAGGGERSFFNVQNRGPVFLGVERGQLNLSGRLIFIGTDRTGTPLPVTVDLNLHAVSAPTNTAACLAQPARQRLFGFEELESWSSADAALSPASSPTTEGCGALSVSGQGYMTIDGGEFSTRGLNVTPALSLDLFIPGNQPNRYWLGALQMYLTCPSANTFNHYVGQVELTGRSTDAYTTLSFPLSGPTAEILRRPFEDCRFSLALNVNPTTGPWLLDNLRFTP